MPWAAAGAAVSAGAGLIGGAMQSSNVSKASAQAQRNLQLILPQMQTGYVNTLAGYQPYSTSGQQGLTATTDLLGLNGQPAADAAMARYQTSPGYEWQMSEGLRGVDAGAAAKGMLRSGATLKQEDIFAQGLANSDFGQYYNRLANLSGQGLTAAQGIGQANQNLVANEEGNAQSQNSIISGAANAQNSIIGSEASSIGTALGGALQNKGVQSSLGGLFGGSSPPINTLFNGFAPAYSPGQAGVGGFVAPTAPSFSY